MLTLELPLLLHEWYKLSSLPPSEDYETPQVDVKRFPLITDPRIFMHRAALDFLFTDNIFTATCLIPENNAAVSFF